LGFGEYRVLKTTAKMKEIAPKANKIVNLKFRAVSMIFVLCLFVLCLFVRLFYVFVYLLYLWLFVYVVCIYD